jgi:two-component sensor histidine kinase
MTWWDVTISAIRDTSGTPTQLVAFSRDMTLAQVQGEASDLLKIELSHRIKNLFALVNGLITVAARPDPAVQSFAEALCDRFAALSRALDYVLPAHAIAASPSATTLQGLLRALLDPYDNLVQHQQQQQVLILGDDPPVGPKATPSLALCIHELATNAVKYGALSNSRGRVSITCRSKAEGVIGLTWSERGGPEVAAKPEQAGFGSKLLLRTISGALGGRVRRRWDRRGLTLHMLVPLATLAQ